MYANELFNHVIPFWTRFSPDHINGGYYTCLDRKGRIYDRDKFTWLQARQVWTYSYLYNQYESNEQWLQIAELGFRFLTTFAEEQKSGSYYFSCDEKGVPLTQPHSIYSDCFAAAGLYEYAKATASDMALRKSKRALKKYLERRARPKGIYTKSTGNRPLSSLGIPMMTAFLYQIFQEEISSASLEVEYQSLKALILNKHLCTTSGLLHEFVSIDGGIIDTFEGRLLNPGHAIEACWFLMDLAANFKDQATIRECSDLCLRMIKKGWDGKHGGIYYFLDSKGAPPQHLEWNQKLWWVQLEALVALSKILKYNPSAEAWLWFQKIHDYAWNHFRDPEYGEWYGYLTEQGNVLVPLKGGKWKGCFHLPRALHECSTALKEFGKSLENERSS